MNAEDAADLQEYMARLDGYLLGVKAGIEAARQIRVDQIVKAHRAKQPPPDQS